MAQTRKTTAGTRKIKLGKTGTLILVGVCLLAIVLMALSEQFNWKYIPTLSEFTQAITGEEAAPAILDGDCSVHFIDVGQGDSILLVADGQTALIDAGENGRGAIVLDYLQSVGIDKIDLLMMSHPHSDHIGGMDEVIRSVDIGRIVMPRLPDSQVPTTKTYTEVLEAIADKGAKITASKVGMELELGKGSFTVLSPGKEYEDLNDTSLVVRFDYGNKSFLFTGDAETPVESQLLQEEAALSADVLKLGHHGSRTSTSKRFYQAVDPEYCVIQVGDGNDYGHPHEKTLNTIATNDAKVYRNDFQGTIVFTIQDGEMTVQTEK